MKPNFALSLSFEGIRLLHRTGTGWSVVGDVSLDSPDLGGELAMLRKTGLALDPAGLRTKLILPNDQVRYLALDTTRATEDDIRATLTGATPYRIDELVWDMVRGGGRTYIAAVARETLQEAENFAADHRFGPVSFTAVPEEFTFIGEPFFGQTHVAETLLPPGERVERDSEPVRLLRPARPAPAAAPQTPLPQPPQGTPAPPLSVQSSPGVSSPSLTVEPEAIAPRKDPELASPVAPDVLPSPVDPVAPDARSSETEEPPLSATEPLPVAANEAASEPPAGPDKTPEPTDTPKDDLPESAPETTLVDAAAVSDDTPYANADPVENSTDETVTADEVITPTADPPVAVVPPAETAATPANPTPTLDAPSARLADQTDSRPDPSHSPTPPLAPPEPPTKGAEAVPDAPPPTATASTLVDSALQPAADPAVPPAPPAEQEPAPVFASRNRATRPLVADPAQRPLPLGAPLPPLSGRPAARPAADDRTEPTFARRTPPPVTALPVTTLPDPPAPVVSAPVTSAPVGAPPAPPARLSIDAIDTPPRPDNQPRITGVTLGAPERATVVPLAAPRATTPAPPPPAVPTPTVPTPTVPSPTVPSPTGQIAAFPTRTKTADKPGTAKPRATGLAATQRPRGKPRFLGLILTALLVAAMLIVALWLGRTDNVVSRFFGTGTSSTEEIAAAIPLAIPLAPAVTESPVPAAAPQPEENSSELVPAEDIAPTIPEPLLPDAAAAAAAAALVASEIGTLASTATTAPREITAITLDEADRFYAATGVWLRAPRLPVEPESEDLADLTLSAMDAAPAARDSTTLPPLGPDPGLVAQANPPPPGTRIPRDERGFILATAEGTVTPDGLVIFAGSPSITPPTRPGTIAPEVTTTSDPITASPTGQPLTAPPTTRPQARTATLIASLPADVAPEPQPALDATAGAVALAAFEGPRPANRPASVEALAPVPFDGPSPPIRPEDLAPETATTSPAEETMDPETALAATLASIVEGAGDPLASATPQAVAVARRPDARPANFARAVQQQTDRLDRATAAAQEQSAPASLGTPEEATEAEEIEVAAVQPSGNVPRSVSEAATMENVMSLREINLIGVYGTPNDRRALVRLENGRYVRVSVGDSLDGGQVAAISDNSLNYVRRGNTITLEIPEG
jgi:hypothetical protein